MEGMDGLSQWDCAVGTTDENGTTVLAEPVRNELLLNVDSLGFCKDPFGFNMSGFLMGDWKLVMHVPYTGWYPVTSDNDDFISMESHYERSLHYADFQNTMLFDLKFDAREEHDMAANQPTLLARMVGRASQLARSAITSVFENHEDVVCEFWDAQHNCSSNSTDICGFVGAFPPW